MAKRLTFRKTGIPLWIKVRVAILVVIFIASMVFFQLQLNKNVTHIDVEMADATLPLVTITSYGSTMAELHGYIKEMDACYIRDALVPLNDERKMTIVIDTYDYNVEQVSYELLTIDQDRKIAENTIDDWTVSDGTMTATVQVANLVDEGEEYFFFIMIDGGGQTLYYYTRITYSDMENLSDCLDFAMYFHDTALSDDYAELATYLEPSDYVDKDTLANVTIESSLDQVGWGSFEGTQMGDVVMQVSDIGDDYVALTLFYKMQETNGSLTYYYTVEEYFKLRYSSERIYLIDYQRDMEQILTEDCVAVADNELTIGICDGDIEYLSSENGSIVGFVVAGELYQYNQNRQTLIKVFGFIDDVNDARQTYSQHEIKILSIDENGNMDFVIFGYMNRGEHEGDCGINLYSYDSSSQETVEQVFISSTHPYEILKANFSNLLYENVSGDFYIMLAGTLAKISTDTVETEDIATSLDSGQYAVSESGRYICWIDEDNIASEIIVMDLETEEQQIIEAPSGCGLVPIAFMNEDFVYGVVQESDIYTNTTGSITYPIKQIIIVDITSEDFEVMKYYDKDGIWVVDVTKEDNTLYLERVTYDEEGKLVGTDSDVIKDSTTYVSGSITKFTKVDSDKGSVTGFTLASLSSGATINSMSNGVASMAVTTSTRSMAVTATDQQETYFVYVGSHITLATQNLTKAINSAYDNMGMVVDNQQNYIWRRGKQIYVDTMRGLQVGEADADETTEAGCLSALLAWEGVDIAVQSLLDAGMAPLYILEKYLEDELILDLTGCTLTQVLYYVSKGQVVYVSTGEGSAYLINGYNSSTIVVYQTDIDKYVRLDFDEAEELFEANGNCFISICK